MRSQSDDKGNSKMAATGQDDVTKVKDEVSKKEKDFGQKAKTR